MFLPWTTSGVCLYVHCLFVVVVLIFGCLSHVWYEDSWSAENLHVNTFIFCYRILGFSYHPSTLLLLYFYHNYCNAIVNKLILSKQNFKIKYGSSVGFLSCKSFVLRKPKLSLHPASCSLPKKIGAKYIKPRK